MRSIALIDYGSGNLRSAEKALVKASGALATSCAIHTTDDPDVIARADAIVLPGVGAFAACVDLLDAKAGLREAICTAVRRRGAPFLGVCVGMQLMASAGLEFGETPGLDWIAGEVRRLEPSDWRYKVPHMGWNELDGIVDHPVFAGASPGTHMYFTHSFAYYPIDERDVAAWTDHGGAFPAAVARGNLVGVQFHPEKSQAAGLRLLANFLEWRP
jgi:imidazole glycerol-phosphate synthase subunit HisH